MKRLLTFLVALAVALALTGCGDDGPSGMDTNDGMDMGDGMDHRGEDNTPVAPGAREIQVAGTSFEFDPDEITIDAGEDVAIVLTSEDILHDFTVEGEEGHVAADGGETASGGFRIDAPGTYTFYCSVAGHREEGMEGSLVVG